MKRSVNFRLADLPPHLRSQAERQIAADNKLLKEIKARITRLYNWSKEQAAQPRVNFNIQI